MAYLGVGYQVPDRVYHTQARAQDRDQRDPLREHVPGSLVERRVYGGFAQAQVG